MLDPTNADANAAVVDSRKHSPEFQAAYDRWVVIAAAVTAKSRQPIPVVADAEVR